jgi:drug/metabolite transporter (DMT)-like permease
VATAVGLVAFYRALAIGTMSIVSPIIAAEVLIPVAAGLLRGERPGLPAYAGMALTVAGVILLSWAKRGESDHIARSAVLLAILAAVCWGLTLLALGVGGRDNPYWAVFDIRAASAAIIVIYVIASGRRLPLKGQNLPALFAVAAGLGFLSVASVLGSLSPVVVTGYAQIFLGERLSARQWAGFGTVFAGVVMLSL